MGRGPRRRAGRLQAGPRGVAGAGPGPRRRGAVVRGGSRPVGRPPAGRAYRRGRRAGGTGRRRGALLDHPALPQRTGRRGGSRRAGPRPAPRRRVPGHPRAGGWPARPDPLGELGAGRGAHAGAGRQACSRPRPSGPGSTARATPDGGRAAPRHGKRSATPGRRRTPAGGRPRRCWPRGRRATPPARPWPRPGRWPARTALALLVTEIQALARRARIELPPPGPPPAQARRAG